MPSRTKGTTLSTILPPLLDFEPSSLDFPMVTVQPTSLGIKSEGTSSPTILSPLLVFKPSSLDFPEVTVPQLTSLVISA